MRVDPEDYLGLPELNKFVVSVEAKNAVTHWAVFSAKIFEAFEVACETL